VGQGGSAFNCNSCFGRAPEAARLRYHCPMNDQRMVVDFLARDGILAPAGTPVERIDTHASILFLAGDRVFKLKRAVALPYLDYGTVEKREAACRAELALNRRTAPRLYLGLRKLARGPRGPCLDGDGPALDWLVEMRRFDEATLFSRLAERHALDPAQLRELADEIARFHDVAAPLPGRGGSAAFRAVIEGNQERLAQSPELFGAAALAGFARSGRAAWERLAPLLDRRSNSGRVRRCHGDLHLGNICLFEGRPTLFDAVEFSEDFSVIDTAYDLAFLLMDLWQRGAHDHANLVFNRYLDRSGDAEALPALPLFLSQRAAIRAHVSVTTAAQQRDGSSLLAAAQGYFALACQLLAPAAPRLVAVGGFSGSGKSSLARGLAPELGPAPGARIARSDIIRKLLWGVDPETRLPASAYASEVTAEVYARMGAEASAALAGGYAAIADAAFLRAEERGAIEGCAGAAGCTFTGFWLAAPEPVLAARIAARRGDPSDADLAVLKLQLGLDIGPMRWIRLKAAGDLASLLGEARYRLSQPRKDS
jgi:aminoglycoside phosphotransferase family enzyme/predicted kinase